MEFGGGLDGKRFLSSVFGGGIVLLWVDAGDEFASADICRGELNGGLQFFECGCMVAEIVLSCA